MNITVYTKKWDMTKSVVEWGSNTRSHYKGGMSKCLICSRKVPWTMVQTVLDYRYLNERCISIICTFRCLDIFNLDPLSAYSNLQYPAYRSLSKMSIRNDNLPRWYHITSIEL